MDGYKELLGIWISEKEGAKFWAQVLTELNNRGVKDVFVFCIDGLTGFPEAIKGIFPKADIQLCIVHMIRNSLKYVSWKDRKAVARDLKEWIGGEHVLAKRAATPEIHNQIIEVCRNYEEHLQAAGQDCRAGQPTPGNKAGGLSTLDEKSLGCIRKGGTRPIVEVLEQAARPTKKGAVVMDTAGFDISSITSMAAGGCNAIIFTTGRGTPTGNAIVPVLKVTANSRTFMMMEDNIDADLSAIIEGTKTYKEMGRELLDVIHDVCNGKLTKAEAYGFSDIAVDHVCRFV